MLNVIKLFCTNYNCIYDVTPEELTEKIDPAKRLIAAIETLISK